MGANPSSEFDWKLPESMKLPDSLKLDALKLDALKLDALKLDALKQDALKLAKLPFRGYDPAATRMVDESEKLLKESLLILDIVNKMLLEIRKQQQSTESESADKNNESPLTSSPDKSSPKNTNGQITDEERKRLATFWKEDAHLHISLPEETAEESFELVELDEKSQMKITEEEQELHVPITDESADRPTDIDELRRICKEADEYLKALRQIENTFSGIKPAGIEAMGESDMIPKLPVE